MNGRPELAAAHSGVYQTSAGESDLRGRAARIGAAWVAADLGAVRDKAALLGVLAEALAFPPEFGRNWDALSDSLQDLGWLPACGYVLHLRNAEGARRALGRDWDTLLDILRESAEHWKGHGRPFIVMVDGTGDLPPWR